MFVHVHPDRVEITNPGGLAPGLTVKDLGTRAVPRNRLIADLFYRMGYVERLGSGIHRMRQSMAQAQLPHRSSIPPKTPSGLHCTLPGRPWACRRRRWEPADGYRAMEAGPLPTLRPTSRFLGTPPFASSLDSLPADGSSPPAKDERQPTLGRVAHGEYVRQFCGDS